MKKESLKLRFPFIESHSISQNIGENGIMYIHEMMRIKKQRICDVGASTTYIGNSIFIMENSHSGGCET